MCAVIRMFAFENTRSAGEIRSSWLSESPFDQNKKVFGNNRR